jgi:hypothetical protein
MRDPHPVFDGSAQAAIFRSDVVAFERLDKRLSALKRPAKADQGVEAVLAEQWNDAAGARGFALDLKQQREGLTEAERAESAQLSACAKAWRRLRHAAPHELAGLDPTIADAERARAWELRLQPFTPDAPPLTEEERRELAGLDARLGAECAAIEAAKRRASQAPRPTRAGAADSPRRR